MSSSKHPFRLWLWVWLSRRQRQHWCVGLVVVVVVCSLTLDVWMTSVRQQVAPTHAHVPSGDCPLLTRQHQRRRISAARRRRMSKAMRHSLRLSGAVFDAVGASQERRECPPLSGSDPYYLVDFTAPPHREVSLTAHTTSLATHLVTAVALGRTMVFAPSVANATWLPAWLGWHLPADMWAHFFVPISTCQSRVPLAINVSGVALRTRRNEEMLAERRQVVVLPFWEGVVSHSVRRKWQWSQLVGVVKQYVLRGSERTVAAVHEAVSTALSVPGFSWRLAMSIPIRASDKCGVEMACVSVAEHLSLAHSVVRYAAPWVRFLVVSSEDPSVRAQVSAALAQWEWSPTVIWNAADRAPGSGNPRTWSQAGAASEMESALTTLALHGCASKYYQHVPASTWYHEVSTRVSDWRCPPLRDAVTVIVVTHSATITTGQRTPRGRKYVVWDRRTFATMRRNGWEGFPTGSNSNSTHPCFTRPFSDGIWPDHTEWCLWTREERKGVTHI